MITQSKILAKDKQVDGRTYVTEEHTDDFFGPFRVVYLAEANSAAAELEAAMTNRASLYNDVANPGAGDDITVLCEGGITRKCHFPFGLKRTQNLSFFPVGADKTAMDRVYNWLISKSAEAIRHWPELSAADKQFIIAKSPSVGKIIDFFSKVL